VLALHFSASCGVSTLMYAFLTWGPALLLRVHGLSPGSVAIVMAIAAGPFALIGFSFGGAWADSMWRRGRHDAHMTVGLWMLSLALPIGLLVSLTSNTLIAIPGLCMLMLLLSAATPAAMAGLQLLCPPHFRGRMSAIFMVVLNLAGVGLPLLDVRAQCR
jgi:hypothetical protein